MNKSEKIGNLSNPVTLRRRVTVENEYAEKVEVWENWKCVWAEIDYPATKSDEEKDLLAVAYTYANFTMRYDAEVTKTMRIAREFNKQTEEWNIKTIRYPKENAWPAYMVIGAELVE